MSVNKNAKATGKRENFKEPIRSRRPIKLKSGAANIPFQVTKVGIPKFIAEASPYSLPIGIAKTVVVIIPKIRAPFTFFRTKTEVIKSPAKNVIVAGSMGPRPTIVAGFATMNLALTKPIRAINNPIPTATAYLICLGIAFTMYVRILKTERIIKIIPAQKIDPNAVSHFTPIPSTTVKVKKAFIPIPGATNNGFFA